MRFDRPGVNVDLRPAQAPAWLHGLVRGTEVGEAILLNEPKESAVLVLLAGDPAARDVPADAGVLITHRSPTMRSHAGQMAFPGGRVDPVDVNAVDAALREAWEETGLDRRTVTPLLQLYPTSVRANLHPVHPILAHWNEPTQLEATSLEETDDVFLVGIDELTDPDNRVMVGYRSYRGPAFRINGYLIWGFTGGILDGMLSTAGWEREWERDQVHDLARELSASRNQESH